MNPEKMNEEQFNEHIEGLGQKILTLLCGENVVVAMEALFLATCSIVEHCEKQQNSKYDEIVELLKERFSSLILVIEDEYEKEPDDE